MHTDGSIVFSTKLDNTQLKRQLKSMPGIFSGLNNTKLKKQLESMPSVLGGLNTAFRKLSIAIGAAFSVGAIMNFGKSCIGIASDLQEVQNVVDTAFGSMKYKMENFAKSSIELFGMSELSSKQMASTYMAMGRGIGLSFEKASDMALGATARIGDIASFYNKPLQAVDTMMKSIWTGETESLKQIGVVMTQTQLQAFALSKGIKANISDLDQATLTQLRYAYVMEQTALAQGDFAKTSGSWANQVRILGQRFNELKGNIGVGLIQALTPALRALNKIVEFLVDVSNLFRQITAELFGKQYVPVQPVQSAADSVNDLASAQNNLAEATDKANKASKRSLASFDELHRLGSTKEDTAAGLANAGSLSGTVGEIKVDTGDSQKEVEGLSEAVRKLKKALEPLKKISFNNLNKSFEKLRESAGKLGKNVWSGLEWAYYNILVPLAGWTIEDFLPAFLNLLSGAIDVLNSVIELFKPFGIWLWDEFLQPVAEWTGGLIVDIINGLADALTRLSDWIDKHQKGLSIFGTILLSIAGAFGTVAAVVAVVGTTLGFLTTHGGLAAAAMAGLHAVTGAVGSAFAWLAANPAVLIIAAIGALIGTIVVLITHWDEVKETAIKAWEKIKEVWSVVSEWFRNNVTEPLSKFFSNAWSGIRNACNNVKDAFIRAWSTVAKWFSDHVTGPLKTSFDTIKINFKNTVNALISLLERGINFMIRKINTLHWDIPEWVPGIGGGKFGFNFNEVRIPRLARGAVIPPNREFLAVLGDQKNGRNLEVPEDVIRQIVKEESGSKHLIVKVYLSRSEISEAVVEDINGEIERTGISPILEGA